MIIRMFEYGFRKGKENADYGGDFHSMLLALGAASAITFKEIYNFKGLLN